MKPTPEDYKNLTMIKEMAIAGALKSIQADHIFKLEKEINKLYSLFFTLDKESIDKSYVLEKITQLLTKKPLSMSYEPTLLAYCLNRGLIKPYESYENIIEFCKDAVKKEGVINFEILDKLDKIGEENENAQ